MSKYNKQKVKLSFYGACFLTGMSADATDYFGKILSEEQKNDFIQHERDTIPQSSFDEVYDIIIKEYPWILEVV